MRASVLSFRAAVIFVAAGMIWGLQMAISQDHSAMAAHAHLNLLGWVSLFLFGIFYRLHPSLDDAKLAIVQVFVWIIGTSILSVGVAMVTKGNPVGEPVAGIGSMIVMLDVLVFGWLVFRRDLV